MAEPKAQRNFIDPESRILKTKDGYIQGNNAQAAVDAQAQVIVAHTLSNNGSDRAQLAPLLDTIKANLGRNPQEASADAGCCSAPNLRTSEPAANQRLHRNRPTEARKQVRHRQTARQAWLTARQGRLAGSSARAIEAATDCVSRWSSRCSDKLSRREGSASSCCEGSRRSRPNGR